MQDEQPSPQAEPDAEPHKTFSFGAFRFDSEGPLLFENGSAVDVEPRAKNEKPVTVAFASLRSASKVVA